MRGEIDGRWDKSNGEIKEANISAACAGEKIRELSGTGEYNSICITN